MATVPPSSFDLPQEVVDAIVDKLYANNDVHSVASVGLVSQVWYPRTRDHLFRKLVIPSPEYYGDRGRRMEARCLELSLVLQGRPMLQRVKTLLFCDIRAALFTQCPWFEDWAIGILPSFTSLTSFFLSDLGSSSSIDGLQWGDVPAKLQETLYSLILQSPLTCLSLAYILNIDIARMAKSQTLQELFLYDIAEPAIVASTAVESRTHPTSHSAPHSSLRSLYVAGCGKALSTLLVAYGQPLTLHPRLLSVDTLCWDEAMAEAFALLMREVGGGVKEYHVRHDCTNSAAQGHPSSRFPTTTFDLMNLPGLESLTITTSTSTLVKEDPDLLSHLVTALNQLSARGYPSQLTEIKIGLYFGPVRIRHAFHQNRNVDPSIRDRAVQNHIEECVRGAAWARLDQTLARPAFSNLRKLSIVVFNTLPLLPDDRWQSMRQALLGKMEELHGRRAIVDCVRLPGLPTSQAMLELKGKCPVYLIGSGF